LSFSLRACCSELLLVTCDNILAARDLAAKKWSLCAMRVCLLSNFVVFAVLAARELATRTVVFHYIPCVCVCVLQLRFHPGSQRPGRQEALVFVCVTCVCLLSNFVLFAVLAARELAARTQWSSIISRVCAPATFSSWPPAGWPPGSGDHPIVRST